MNGVEHIHATFEPLRLQRRAALMPYFTIGYPDAESSLEIIEAIANSGADLIEIGIPFSDPLADGPTIQHSAQVALSGGITVARSLELVKILRQRGIAQPLLLMGYINPILAYGIERFVWEATAAGADGFIVPDLPPEEAKLMEDACKRAGRALVYLLAPTSTPERIALVAEHSSGFIYLVSVTGVTGARQAVPDDLAAFVNRVRSVTDMPLAVGFGISNSQQAARIGELADGVIVGSALINTVKESTEPCAAVARFVGGLHSALLIGAAAKVL